MKKKKVITVIGGFCAVLIMFAGCGERSGESEYNKAMASWKGGDLVRAQGQLEKAIRKISSTEKKAQANNQLGIILWKLDKHEQAIEQFSEACRLTEGISGANLNLGISLCLAGKIEQAEFQFTKILNEQPGNPGALTYMGLVQMQKQEWKGAAQGLANGLRQNPTDAAGQNALALTELHVNRNSNTAITRLKQVVAADPDYAPAAYNLAVIHDHWLGNKSAARAWYKRYLSKAGTDGPRSAAAKQAIARLAGNGAEAAAKLIMEGTKLHAAKKYAEAVAAFELAIQADATQKTGFYNMGLSLYELKKHDRATEAFVDTLKRDPNFVNARYMLALSYVQQRNWSEAEREAQNLEKLDSTKAQSLLKYISAARTR
jgi:tetratricopeptide (TPR) repeat protein